MHELKELMSKPAMTQVITSRSCPKKNHPMKYPRSPLLELDMEQWNNGMVAIS
jgi:hypothetical protein